MTDLPEHPVPTLSRRTLVILVVLACAAVLIMTVGDMRVSMTVVMSAVLESVGIAAVLIAAGGFGHIVLRRLYPKDSPLGLQVVTSCAAGLWMLSTAVLLVGSLTDGLLKIWFWWPVLGVGVLLAGMQSRKRINKWRPAEKFDGRALLWVVIAAAVGIYLAGVARPPGFVGKTTGVAGSTYDCYDVLEYHLQVPREFYNAQHIGELQHNCYSYYPMGVEMLYLLAMCLRGGAYEGMYLAKMMHGMFAALAVAGIFLAMKRDEEPRGRLAAGLMITTPFVIYLSWLAMVELAEICYLTLAVLWLREWFARPQPRSAVAIGLMLGAACAVKYLSVGLIFAPVIAVMLPFSLARPKRLAHVAAAILATGVMFSPWLVRNLIYTRNPVFPLATTVFGRGHWSKESEQRWLSGHGPQFKPPVPQPADWKQSPQPDRIEMLYHNFVTNQLFGTLMMAAAGVGLCLVLAYQKRAGPWNLAIIGVLAIQLAVWAAFTHGMPGRFITLAIVPLCLLAGEALARLAQVKTSPFNRSAPPSPRGPWGLAPAVVIFAAIIGVNLTTAYNVYRFDTEGFAIPPVPGDDLAVAMPENSRTMLVGQAPAFYFPPNTIYATAFDSHPLAEMFDSGCSPAETLEKLKHMGITHLWVNWMEINRLANSYGYPAGLSRDVIENLKKGSKIGIAPIDAMIPLGVTEYQILPAPKGANWPAGQPMITIYSLYGEKAPATAPETR